MPSIRSSLLHFLIWLVVVTVLFGVVALGCAALGIPFFNQAISMLIMLPYMISFYQTTQYFIKKYDTLPTNKQRWLISISCVMIFWIYSVIAGFIGLWLSDVQIQLKEIPPMNSLLLLFIGYIFIINAFLILMGYFFLGKPAQIMLERQTRKSP